MLCEFIFFRNGKRSSLVWLFPTVQLVPKGVPWTTLKKHNFPGGILWLMLHHIFIHYKKPYSSEKIRKKKKIYRFKMAAKLLTFALRHFDFGKNFEKHFPKRICQWNLAHNWKKGISVHYLYKIWTFLFLWDFRGKRFPLPCLFMPLSKKMTGSTFFFFFFDKRRVFIGVTIKKKHRSKNCSEKTWGGGHMDHLGT